MKLRAMRADQGASIAAAALFVFCAYVALDNRYLLLGFPPSLNALFWDANVFAVAGEQVADGINPYFEDVITYPFPLPFISAPQVAGTLAGLSKILGSGLFGTLVFCHLAALTIAPLILSRTFLGRTWQDAALGYGLFVCGLGAFGVTTIIAGNFGSALYLAIFAALIAGLRNGNWLWFHIAVAVAVQVKPPYGLLWVVPVLVNGWSLKQALHAAMAACAAVIPYVAAYLVDGTYFNNWLSSLTRQVTDGDSGFSAFGGMIRLDNNLQTTPWPMVAHILVCAPLLLFLFFDRTKGPLKAAALVAFAILANPRMKEYDVAFAAIPVAALYLAVVVQNSNNNVRRAFGIGFLVALTGATLRFDHVPLLGPFSIRSQLQPRLFLWPIVQAQAKRPPKPLQRIYNLPRGAR